jgi:hypothetical protein
MNYRNRAGVSGHTSSRSRVQRSIVTDSLSGRRAAGRVELSGDEPRPDRVDELTACQPVSEAAKSPVTTDMSGDFDYPWMHNAI